MPLARLVLVAGDVNRPQRFDIPCIPFFCPFSRKCQIRLFVHEALRCRPVLVLCWELVTKLAWGLLCFTLKESAKVACIFEIEL